MGRIEIQHDKDGALATLPDGMEYELGSSFGISFQVGKEFFHVRVDTTDCGGYIHISSQSDMEVTDVDCDELED